jgi:uncharacterized membrane-anchored protein
LRRLDTFHPRAEPLAAKVPEITVMFWAVKLLTTYMGEATSDWLGDVNVVLGAFVELALVLIALRVQLRVRRYRAPAYWFLAMSIAIFGTGVADAVHQVGIPYVGTTILWWHRREGTLSIHSVTTRRRELYYWATVFSTFALGTALGDLTATSIDLGYFDSAMLFLGIIMIPLLAWRLGLNDVVAFWFAYVVTRPLGASFADFVSKPHNISGINFGDGATAGTAFPALVILVAVLDRTGHGVQPDGILDGTAAA